MINKIDVAKEFSARPYGRYRDDGEFSAQRFREEFLLPAFEQGLPFLVDLSGSNRYGSSFLEEAFGGLIRDGITQEQLGLMEIKHELLPSIPLEAKEYIEQAISANDN
ncbi:hypothetical protein TDB9533_01208 [Thalassocella blandensis]|nr:hypothetical protein TDB9533_01208 [Thalassocella blandensis]